MKTLFALLLILILHQSLAIKVIKGKDIPKDYSIGKLMHVDFGAGGKMLFRTTKDLMGIIDIKTGFLTTIFQLDSDQKIINYEGIEKVVIAKGHDINVFMPKDQTYVKLSYSEYLEKQKFKEVISYRRLFKFDYILTDEFLLKAQNPMAAENPIEGEPQTYDKYEIMAEREDKTQTFIQIILVVQGKDFKDVILGLVFTKVVDTRTLLCMRKMFLHKDKVTQKCAEIDSKQKILGVIEVGPMMVVTFETYKIVLNQKMVITHELRGNEHVSFFEELNIVGDPTVGKNLNSDDVGNTLLFFIRGNPEAGNNLQFFQTKMLIKKDKSVITSIEKQSGDIPVSVWGFTQNKQSNIFILVVEYENKKIQCFQIDIKEKSNKKIWNFIIRDPVQFKGGEEKEANDVGLQEEEKILEDIEQSEQAETKKEEEQEKEELKKSDIDLDEDEKKEELKTSEIDLGKNDKKEEELNEKKEVDLNEKKEVDLNEKKEVDLNEKKEVDLNEKKEVNLNEKKEVELKEKKEVDLKEKKEQDLNEKKEKELREGEKEEELKKPQVDLGEDDKTSSP